jgi:outer membrane protein assembly factor BamB
VLRITTGVLAAAVLVAAPAAGGQAATSSAFVVLADNVLLRLELPSGRVAGRRVLGARSPSRFADARHAIAIDRASMRVLVLASGARGRPDSIVIVHPRTLAVRARFRLDRGVDYRGVLFARSTGLLYAYGSRKGRFVDPQTKFGEYAAVVTVLRASDGRILARWTVRPANRLEWWTYWAVFSADERRLILSYHGSNTTGADVLTLTGTRFAPCAPTRTVFPRSGCSGDVHGMAEPYGEGFVAATGGTRVVVLDERGEVVRRVRTGLQTHHMDFALSGDGRLFGIGPCGKIGGLWAVDLAAGTTVRLRPARGSTRLCGSRVIAAGGRLFVATGAGAPPFETIPTAVLILDERSGRTLRRIRTGSFALDIAVW